MIWLAHLTAGACLPPFPRSLAVQTMDELDYLIRDHGISGATATRLRLYFRATKEQQRARSYQALVEAMSPTLQGDVAFEAHGRWLRHVWFFRELMDEHNASRRAELVQGGGSSGYSSDDAAEDIDRGVPPSSARCADTYADYSRRMFMAEIARLLETNVYAPHERPV